MGDYPSGWSANDGQRQPGLDGGVRPAPVALIDDAAARSRDPHKAFHPQYSTSVGYGPAGPAYAASVQQAAAAQNPPFAYPHAGYMPVNMTPGMPAQQFVQPGYEAYAAYGGQHQTYMYQLQSPYPMYPIPQNNSGSVSYAPVAQHMSPDMPPSPGMTMYQQFQPAPSFYPQPSFLDQQMPVAHHGPNLNSRSGSRRLSQGRKGSFRTIASTFANANSYIGQQSAQVLALDPNRAQYTSLAMATAGSKASSSDTNTVPRGPPRKPRQSGFAMWVGNLPPHATVIDLKDHFSRGATQDIDSVKLISKSNCAFVNYKTQVSCEQAMHRFHDTRFHGSRLVCRLRKTVESLETDMQNSPASALSPTDPDGWGLDGARPFSPENSPAEASEDKFFVLKSLTLVDLVMSTNSRLWATQPHNEDILNKAFATSKNVYLFFSVNKSGEYFGLGRMASPITISASGIKRLAEGANAPAQAPSSVPASKAATNASSGSGSAGVVEAPREIITASTETAPAGRIVDDLARGTIFWEAFADEEEASEARAGVVQASKGDAGRGSTYNSDGVQSMTTEAKIEALPRISINVDSTGSYTPASKTGAVQDIPAAVVVGTAPSGNAFQVEWLSTTRVPFYKTRGIRNPLNGNREVKIARDGTRIALDVGVKLMELFGVARKMDQVAEVDSLNVSQLEIADEEQNPEEASQDNVLSAENTDAG